MSKKFTQLQKIMLINANPVKNFFNFIGLVFALYFLWNHQAINALIWGLGIILSGTIIATIFFNKTPEEMAEIWLGVLYLSYANGVGFFLYMTSHFLIPYGFWLNNLLVSIVGLFCLIVGWLLGTITLASN